MKIWKASYMDDGVLIPGILVERFLRKPVFYAADQSCGWDSQVITKRSKGVIMLGGCGSGKARRFAAAQGNEKDDFFFDSEKVFTAHDTYNGCTKQQILDATNELLASINKFDEPIVSTPDFLLLIDCINGLSRRLGEGYSPSRELQQKHIGALCSLAQDVIAERALKKSKE